MQLRVSDDVGDEPLRQTHIRVYMEVVIPGSGGKRIAVSHDYSKEVTIDEMSRGNNAPMTFMTTKQLNKLLEGLEELIR